MPEQQERAFTVGRQRHSGHGLALGLLPDCHLLKQALFACRQCSPLAGDVSHFVFVVGTANAETILSLFLE